MKNADKKDCIPYQLSKLFASLQILAEKMRICEKEDMKTYEGYDENAKPEDVSMKSESKDDVQDQQDEWMKSVIYSKIASTHDLTSSF